MDYRTAQGTLMLVEREALFDLAQQVAAQSGPRVITNLGVQFGASCVCLRQGCPDADLYGIDIDLAQLPQKVRDELGPHTFLIERDSMQYVPAMLDACERSTPARLNLVFVDGLHYKDFVRNDAQLSRLVILGGFMAFHDAYEWDHPEREQLEVYPPIQEWLAQYPGEWQELPKAGTTRIFQRVAGGG